MSKHSKVGLAALRSGMDRKTASKYLASGQLPSASKTPRTWLTHEDAFAEDWALMAEMLRDAPGLEAKALFEHLCELRPGRYSAGQLRSFQRRVKRWRGTEGPAKEVFFAQLHRPGEALQTDFTYCAQLGVTIAGALLMHLLCHVVLPYSNWAWVTVCRSESMAALRRGVQAAVFRLGHVAEWHQTDNSTAATHQVGGSDRDFNEDYAALMRHLGMKPRTIAVGKKEQNGDVEALNGALKRRVEQHLILRGSRDFESVGSYESWLWGVMEKGNALRAQRFADDLAALTPLRAPPLPEYTSTRTGVSIWSTIRIKHNSYSVPSRLIGEQVDVRVYEDRLQVYYGGALQARIERLLGRNGHTVNYRHVIWSLVKKPGAFERYRYREDLFPSLVFRRAYDVLAQTLDTTRKADIEYLRILHLAASTMESDVEAALELLLESKGVPTAICVKSLVSPEQPEVPLLAVPDVDLLVFDELLESPMGVAQ